jgi:hypothetical protein
MEPNGDGWTLAPYRWRAIAAASVSLISVDLPDPDTPVTQVSSPTGMRKSTFCRLLPRAPDSSSQCSPGGIRAGGTSIRMRRDR